MVWWLAVVLQLSSPFLSSRSSMSASLRAPLLSRLDEPLCDQHPFAYCVSAGAGDNIFESLVLSNTVQEAVNLKCVSSLTGPLPRRQLFFVLS